MKKDKSHDKVQYNKLSDFIKRINQISVND